MFWRVNQTKLGREEGESPKGKQTRRDGMLGIHVPTGNQTRANECRNRQREREREELVTKNLVITIIKKEDGFFLFGTRVPQTFRGP